MFGNWRRAAPAPAPRGAPVAVVCATRIDEARFWHDTHLGRSLPQVMAASPGRVTLHAAYRNGAGLSAVYNAALAGLDDAHIAVFVHDDVLLRDYHLCTRLDDALAGFDVVGVAGNSAPAPDHTGWLWRRGADGALVPDAPERLAGVVDHLLPDGGHGVLAYEAAPRAVQLLDGVFIAARVGALRRHGVAFDTRFAFHFYDIDFSRACVRAGLKVGTWPIALSHASEGAFASPEWEEGLRAYRDKWGGQGVAS